MLQLFRNLHSHTPNNTVVLPLHKLWACLRAIGLLAVLLMWCHHHNHPHFLQLVHQGPGSICSLPLTCMDSHERCPRSFSGFMWERVGLWPVLLGWLGCASHSGSDLILACLVCWLLGALTGAFITGLILSRAARNILWGCLSSCLRELHPVAHGQFGGGHRLARYRPVHEHQA